MREPTGSYHDSRLRTDILRLRTQVTPSLTFPETTPDFQVLGAVPDDKPSPLSPFLHPCPV